MLPTSKRELPLFLLSVKFTHIGCYKDNGNRAMPVMEGSDPILDGPPQQRENAISKCAFLAKKLGFTVFSVQNGGECFSGPNAMKDYDKYGPSSVPCTNGKGAGYANDVYFLDDMGRVASHNDNYDNYVKLCYAML